jgi:hypothetical protein
MQKGRYSHQPATYQIKVQGKVNQQWLHNFESLKMNFDGSATTFTGCIFDQAALRGFLNSLWDLNLVLFSVERFERENEDG